MSVYKLKDGRWIVQYRDKKRPGKYNREYFPRGVMGEKRARQRNTELGLNPYQKRTALSSPLIEDLTEAYLQYKKSRMSKNSMRILLYILTKNLLPFFGSIEALKIDASMIDQYINQRIRHVKKISVIRELTVLQAILNFAAHKTRQYIPHNPVAGYDRSQLNDSEIIRPPDSSEVRAIFLHASVHLARALKIAYYTGIRPGPVEMFSLTWLKNVNFHSGVFFIESAKKGKKKSFRKIPIHQKFSSELKEWYRGDAEKQIPWLIHYKGKNIKSIKKSFANAKRKAGITRRLPPYAFRHLFATVLLESNQDVKCVSELMGQATPAITMNVYQHISSSLKIKTVNALPFLQC